MGVFFMERKILRNSVGIATAFGISVSFCAETSVAEAPPANPNVYSNYVQVVTQRSHRRILPGIHVGSLPTARSVIEGVEGVVSSKEVPENLKQKEPEVLQFWTGTATWYSRDGCVGCSEDLLMANGEELNDNRFTAAFNKAPLGSRIRITNLENGNKIDVLVTDTGGFENIGDGRIVDVTPIVRDALGFIDMTHVKVELLSGN